MNLHFLICLLVGEMIGTVTMGRRQGFYSQTVYVMSDVYEKLDIAKMDQCLIGGEIGGVY